MPIIIHDGPCTYCNICAEVCPGDIIEPDRDRTAPPVVLYQDECWHCGTCIHQCPAAGAIELTLPDRYRQPLINKAVRKADGTIELMTRLPVSLSRPPME